MGTASNPRKELVKKLSEAKIMLAADVDQESIGDTDVNILVSKIIELKGGQEGIKVVTKSEVVATVEKINEDNIAKTPKPIEVSRSAEFKPVASEVEAEYQIEGLQKGRAEGNVNDFVLYFRNRVEKIREMIAKHRNYSVTPSIETLKGYAEGRDVTIVGIVTTKITTKKGNVMMVLEDETGEAKVMFMNSQSDEGKKLFKSATRIINDEVIAIRGKTSGPFVMSKEILWPDVPIMERKSVDEDVAIAFISDIHMGSKLFMERNFSKMLDWLNGNVNSDSKPLAEKIKYLILAGDVADGIGVYPGQNKDLAVLDVYKQYKMLAGFLEAIPDYIHVFVMPGNHDAVQRAEPQPRLTDELIEMKQSNIHFVPNPSYLRVHGINVLAYHGTSLDSMISSVPGMSYARPEEAMIEILKRRHLSPIYGGNIIVPTKDDMMVISDTPDILAMGHVHKNGLSEYHGVQIVNSGTWQGRTDFQVRMGHIPTPCILPVFEVKKYAFTTVNFDVV